VRAEGGEWAPRLGEGTAGFPGRDRASPDGLGTVNGGPKSRLHVVIVALVLVLFLAPGQLSVRVLLRLLQQEVEGEW
jgi:hypothetical protein